MRRYMVELSIIGRLVMTGWGGGGVIMFWEVLAVL